MNDTDSTRSKPNPQAANATGSTSWTSPLKRLCLLSTIQLCLMDSSFAMHLISDTPDHVPHIEPYHPRANQPYCIKKQCFKPNTKLRTFKEQGLASWYGHPFHGRKTSTGERYNMYSLTAASTSLPIPSYARVTNLENKKSIIVRINDRGPFIKGRILDLSYAAAHKLGFTQQGTAQVYVEWIHPEHLAQQRVRLSKNYAGNLLKPHPPSLSASRKKTSLRPTQGAHIQIGFFKHPRFAEELKRKASAHFPNLPIHVRSVPHGFRILIGPLTQETTPDTLHALQKRFPESFVVHSSPRF